MALLISWRAPEVKADFVVRTVGMAVVLTFQLDPKSAATAMVLMFAPHFAERGMVLMFAATQSVLKLWSAPTSARLILMARGQPCCAG